jgi:hypothetical protein
VSKVERATDEFEARGRIPRSYHHIGPSASPCTACLHARSPKVNVLRTGYESGHRAARASLTFARRFATGPGYAKLAEAARFTGDRSGTEERSADQRAGVRRTGAERSLPGAPHA